jgi:hypothetical protein
VSSPSNPWQYLGFTVDVSPGGVRGAVSAPGQSAAPTAAAPTVGEPRMPAAESSSSPASVSGAGVIPQPTMLGMALSATTSLAKFVASGFKRVEPQTHQSRLATCSRCEYHNGNRCRVCGCFTDKKAWLPHEDCPIGRWPA